MAILSNSQGYHKLSKYYINTSAYALAHYVNDETLKNCLEDVEYVPVDVFHFGFNKSDINNSLKVLVF